MNLRGGVILEIADIHSTPYPVKFPKPPQRNARI